MISAEIIADSLCVDTGARITTFKLTYPRFVHAELMTHRAFSRNAASSRAIPFKKFLDEVCNNPAIPIHWGSNKPGMQAGEEIEDKEAAIMTWLEARNYAVKFAENLHALGLHKQIVNRLLEPWFHISVLVTATEYDNFFYQRSSEYAEPHIADLSDKMLELYCRNSPKLLRAGEWHLPYSDEKMNTEWSMDNKLKVCTARAARLSYNNFDKESSFEDDIALFEKLKSGGHWSPFEHPAQALNNDGRFGNFTGFRSFRKMFESENKSLSCEDRAKLLKERKVQK